MRNITSVKGSSAIFPVGDKQANKTINPTDTINPINQIKVFSFQN